MRDTNLQCFTIFNSLFNSLLCCHSPTATVALWGDSVSRVDSGGVSMGLSRSSGAWPSPRDHTGQLGETHTWHSALHCHCARKNTAVQLRNPEIHPPFTFHLKVLVSPEESYTDRRTHFFSLSVITLHTAAEFKLFATWKAWNRQYENTETASIAPNLRDISCTGLLHSPDAPVFFVFTFYVGLSSWSTKLSVKCYLQIKRFSKSPIMCDIQRGGQYKLGLWHFFFMLRNSLGINDLHLISYDGEQETRWATFWFCWYRSKLCVKKKYFLTTTLLPESFLPMAGTGTLSSKQRQREIYSIL